MSPHPRTEAELCGDPITFGNRVKGFTACLDA